MLCENLIITLIFTGKHLRLKQAKEEAHAEIQCLKNEKEEEFKDHEAKVTSERPPNT